MAFMLFSPLFMYRFKKFCGTRGMFQERMLSLSCDLFDSFLVCPRWLLKVADNYLYKNPASDKSKKKTCRTSYTGQKER